MESFGGKFNKWIKENQLLVINVVLKKVGSKTILGRMVQYDPIKNSILVYVDDTKTIESFMINEIDDISPSTFHISW